jgi:hypothetical protein
MSFVFMLAGLLMEMDTPKVRAMQASANAGIAAQAPRSPAVTPSGIAAAARAFAAARAAQTDAGATGTDKEEQPDAAAEAEACRAAAAAAAKAVAAAKYKCVLDLSTPPGKLQQPEQQQVLLPVPAFQQFFGGKRLPGGSSAAAGSSGAADAAGSADVDTAEASAAALKSAAAATAPAAPTEPPPAAGAATTATDVNANGKRSRVLNLGDEPTPTAFKGGVVTATVAPAQVVAAVSCNSGAAGAPAAKKMAVGFLPALHEIERMI